MSKITLDDGLRAKLNGLNEEFEVCDTSGQTIGHFLPEAVYQKWLYQIAVAQCPYTKEQIVAMSKQTGGRTLEDWKRSMGILQ